MTSYQGRSMDDRVESEQDAFLGSGTERHRLDSYTSPRTQTQLTPATSGTDSAQTASDLYKSDAEEAGLTGEDQDYRLYKRRFVGLFFMVVLNFVTSMERSSFGPIAGTVAKYFEVPFHRVESLSSVSGFAILAPSPFVIFVLNKAGPKWSLVLSCAIYITGSWVHYAGAASKDYGTFVAGTIIVSIATPFSLVAATRYSRLWFNEKGRTSATGIATLSSSIGSAVGSVMTPNVIASTGMHNLTLIYGIVASVVCAISIFIPSKPPTPPTAIAGKPRLGIWPSIKVLVRAKPFWLQFYSFSVQFGAYEALNSLTLNMINKYGGTQEEAGIANAVLVVAGIIAAAIATPIIDRTKSHLLVVKVITPLLAIGYTGLIFIPQARSPVALYVMFGYMGVLLFSITPATLEFQGNWTYPASVEVSSTICWTGGFLVSSLFIIAMEDLVPKTSWGGQPAGSLFRGMIFLAGMVWSVVPFSWLTGVWIFKRPEVSRAPTL